MKKIAHKSKSIINSHQTKLSTFDETKSLSNFAPSIRKSVNPFILFAVILIVVNVVAYKSIKEDIQLNQVAQLEQLKREMLFLKHSQSNDVSILNRINDLNDKNRDELIHILNERIRTSVNKLKQEQQRVEVVKQEVKIDFDKYINSKKKGITHYNSATISTLYKEHELVEQRYKERNESMKDIFLETHDLRKPANIAKLKKLEDKLTLEHYALQEQNRLERRKLRKQKFIYNK